MSHLPGAAPTPAQQQAAFLEALGRMEHAVLEELRHWSSAGVTASSGHAEAVQGLEDRVGEVHTHLKESGERAEWKQGEVLEGMTREVQGLRNDLQSFVRVMAMAVVTLVVVLGLLILFRLG